jgi:hypothetical protein
VSSGAEDSGNGRRRAWRLDGTPSWLREPLLYFLLIGTLIFGVDFALRRDVAMIHITRAVRDEIARSTQIRLGRPAGPAELDAELEHWKQREALYREGLKMGLLEGDPSVRAHIAGQLLNVARERYVLQPPTDAELRDFLERHRRDYSLPASFDFDQVFVSRAQGDARVRAEDVLSKLRAGASPDGLGDWFPRGNRFTGEPLPNILGLLGEPAATAMPSYVLGEWNLVEGPRGFHVVRVTRVDRGEPDFDKLHQALLMGFEAEQRERAADAYAREVEARYRFVNSE